MCYRTLFLTERGRRHQQDALNAAPAELDVTILRQPDLETLRPHLAETVLLISERAGVMDRGLIAAAPRRKMILRPGSLPDNPLRRLAAEGPRWNVLLTPHTAAGVPPAGVIPTRASDYEPILRFLRGEPIAYRLV
ncbi:MAG: hypothetical protein ACP5UQ_09350 [Anaerolineae bacterium]